MVGTEQFASGQFINILIVIDTEYIKQRYPNPSKDKNNPTGIDHNSQFMLVTGARGIISGQGTADLHFKANTGDLVSFRGTSIYANSDDAVIVYGIEYWKGTEVFNPFNTNLIIRNRAVMPDPNSQDKDGLPPIQTQINFANYSSQVRGSGTEFFYVKIALYTLADDGHTQNLFGYFYWDPAITVPG